MKLMKDMSTKIQVGPRTHTRAEACPNSKVGKTPSLSKNMVSGVQLSGFGSLTSCVIWVQVT